MADATGSKNSDGPGPSSRAWYGATINEFLDAKSDAILGHLVRNGEFDAVKDQSNAWIAQIQFLQVALVGLQGSIFFEFTIPRMGRRIDTVLLIGPVAFAVEFKVGEQVFDRASLEQVWDYALDLKNFHEASHSISIVPILVATGALSSDPIELRPDEDGVYKPIKVHAAAFRGAIVKCIQAIVGTTVDGQAWSSAAYRPTPTIIEAARSLYAKHSVEAIARFDAGTQNLRVTSLRVEDLVEEAREKQQKAICFVTGVPGAGKTLVGLNVATRKRDKKDKTHAVFLSGNGPLVAVLHEALTRDEMVRRRALGQKVRKNKVGESIKAFIQNVHHFRDDALKNDTPPSEHVVIFDEAQRAWNLRQTANFMRRKKNRANFDKSEPEFLISYMDRHKDWAAIVCLVGGGQEINTGEAGIEEWLNAAISKFPDWKIFISSRLVDQEYAAGDALNIVRANGKAQFDDDLHLSVPMRSFRSEHVSNFVKALLDCDVNQARVDFSKLAEQYPIAITRDIDKAKRWIRARARGSERYGLVASSKAQRLKPHAIDVRVDVNPVHWFLNDSDDTRSSYYLEDAATEFQVQGLELDWVCVTWDGDLRFDGSGWAFHDYRGKRWCNIENRENRRYLRNAYRVLLTRARQGMVIFVPPGDATDPTRSPKFYDLTFEFLKGLGIRHIQ